MKRIINLSTWTTSETRSALREVLPEVGEVWRTRDAESRSRIDLLWTTRFLMGHCHVGAFALPWDVDEWVACPWCGDDFTRDHFLWDCRGLSQEWQRLLLRVDLDRGSLHHLALYHGTRLGQYLRAAGRPLETVRVSVGHE